MLERNRNRALLRVLLLPSSSRLYRDVFPQLSACHMASRSSPTMYHSFSDIQRRSCDHLSTRVTAITPPTRVDNLHIPLLALTYPSFGDGRKLHNYRIHIENEGDSLLWSSIIHDSSIMVVIELHWLLIPHSLLYARPSFRFFFGNQ